MIRPVQFPVDIGHPMCPTQGIVCYFCDRACLFTHPHILANTRTHTHTHIVHSAPCALSACAHCTHTPTPVTRVLCGADLCIKAKLACLNPSLKHPHMCAYLCLSLVCVCECVCLWVYVQVCNVLWFVCVCVCRVRFCASVCVYI